MGDALGAQTEQWTIDEIAQQHSGLVTTFGQPPMDTFAGANNGKQAEVTDDASQMYYLARALIAAHGKLDYDGWVACLLDWAATSPKAGFMGPSTANMVKALQSGEDVGRVGVIGSSLRKMTTVGNTNGAAMRVAPCGMIHPGDLEGTCEQAFITCLPSHDTDVAIASACCVAAAVSEALVNPSLSHVIPACRRGAQMGDQIARDRARRIAGPHFIARLEMALEIAARSDNDHSFMVDMERNVGNSVLAAESVPAAIGVIVYAKADPLRTIALSASIGNDTDSIATIAGAIVGAMHGTKGLPQDLYREFLQVNDKDYQLADMARQLAALSR